VTVISYNEVIFNESSNILRIKTAKNRSTRFQEGLNSNICILSKIFLLTY